MTYENKFTAGAGIRAQAIGVDAISFLLGFYPNIPQSSLFQGQSVRIGYSFDRTMQSLRFSSNNTHEIQINYIFGKSCMRLRHPRDMKYNNGSD